MAMGAAMTADEFFEWGKQHGSCQLTYSSSRDEWEAAVSGYWATGESKQNAIDNLIKKAGKKL